MNKKRRQIQYPRIGEDIAKKRQKQKCITADFPGRRSEKAHLPRAIPSSWCKTPSIESFIVSFITSVSFVASVNPSCPYPANRDRSLSRPAGLRQ